MEDKEKVVIIWWLWYVWSNVSLVFSRLWYDVVILDNFKNSWLENLQKIHEVSEHHIEFFEVDIQNYKKLKSIMQENLDANLVIYVWGIKNIEESCQEPFQYYQNNVKWFINLLYVMDELKLKNLIVSSSSDVYDSKKTIPLFVERDATIANSPYWTSNLIIEQIAKNMSDYKKFNIVVLRLFSVIWTDKLHILWDYWKHITWNVVNYMIKVAMWKMDKLNIYWWDYNTDDWTLVRDYVDVNDVANAYALSFGYIKEFLEFNIDNWIQKWLFDVFNISTWQWFSIKKIVEITQKVTNIKFPTKIVSRKDWYLDSLVWSYQKAKNVLWWEPVKTVYQSIEDSWKFFKNNVF